jgi:hypothetical protein
MCYVTVFPYPVFLYLIRIRLRIRGSDFKVIDPVLDMVLMPLVSKCRLRNFQLLWWIRGLDRYRYLSDCKWWKEDGDVFRKEFSFII